MHAHFFGASNFKTLCYKQSDTTCAMMVWFLIKCCVLIECISGDREVRGELWCATVRNLVTTHTVNKMKQFPVIINVLLSTLLLHLHSNCLRTHVCFVSSSSNKLPNFISATKFQNYVMVGWVHNEVLACKAVSKVCLQLCLIFTSPTAQFNIPLYLLFWY